MAASALTAATLIIALSGALSYSVTPSDLPSHTEQPVFEDAVPTEIDLDVTNDNLLGSYAGGLTGGWSDTWKSCPEYGDAELPKNASVTCHGVKIMRRILAQLISSSGNLDIGDGIQLVRIPSEETSGRGMWQHAPDLLTRVKKFLRSHELRIKLPELLPSGEEWAKFLQQLGVKKDVSTGRKKDKGGHGMMMAMALMMKGMMTAMGMGGLGLLAMKALMVSGLALMLSAIVGVKSLTHHEDKGGGHVVSYHVPVSHSSEHGHHYKKKRSAELHHGMSLAYRGHT